jgi:hypothetical protein
VRKLLYITIPTVLLATAGAAAVAATTTPVNASVKPNLPKHGTEMIINAGPFATTNSLPTSLKLTLGRGFTTATAKKSSSKYRPGWADSTPELCKQSQAQSNSCPDDTKIGRGTMNLTISGSVLANGTLPLNMTMYAVQPPAGACPMGVLLVVQSGTGISNPLLGNLSSSTQGTLCRHGGGLVASFTSLPNFSAIVPSTTTVTLNHLNLSAGASTLVKTTTKKHGKTVTTRKRNYLLTTPGSCPASRKWNGSLAIGFKSGTVTVPFAFTCKK